MKDSMPGIANYTQMYSQKHPGEEVKIFFMLKSATYVFHYVNQYDMLYGEHFYDLTWNNGISHEQLLQDIEIPCIYLHATEKMAEKIGISRQAYAKWEKGESVPDVMRCQKLAELYGTSIDSLLNCYT